MINKIEQTRRRLQAKGKKIINLSSGNPNEWGIFFKNKKVEAALEAFISGAVAYHPEAFGSGAARRSLQQYYSKKIGNITFENIALTSGSSESYFHLFRILASADGEILLPKPGYPLFEEIARLNGTKISYYDLDEKNGWQIDEKKLEKQITPKTRAIVIVTPNNPTGTVLNKKSLQTVLQVAEKNKLSIISDEVFSEYFFGKGKFPHIAGQKSTGKKSHVPIFTLNGISKTYAMPGFKLGWILMNNVRHEIKEELERSLDALLATNQITQTLLPVILKTGDSFIKQTTKRIQQNRVVMKNIFGKEKNLTYRDCEGGFYTFVKIDGMPFDDETFTIKCMEQTGIFVHPGYFYDYENGLYIVISLLPIPEDFRKYLTKIKNFIQAHTQQHKGK